MIDKVAIDMAIEEWVEEAKNCCPTCRVNIDLCRDLTLADNMYYRNRPEYLGARLIAAGMTQEEIDTLRTTLSTAGETVEE